MAQPTHNIKMSAENQDNIHEDHDCQIPSKNKRLAHAGLFGLGFFVGFFVLVFLNYFLFGVWFGSLFGFLFWFGSFLFVDTNMMSKSGPSRNVSCLVAS